MNICKSHRMAATQRIDRSAWPTRSHRAFVCAVWIKGALDSSSAKPLLLHARNIQNRDSAIIRDSVNGGLPEKLVMVRRT